MKKKVMIGICILLLAVLLIPIPLRLKDGGTVRYQAILYTISNVHRFAADGNAASFETGVVIEIFGFEVFNNVFVTAGKLPSGETEAVQPGGAAAGGAFDIAVSYANWGDQNEIYSGALNVDKMVISSVRHLPIYKFDTLAELEQFKNNVKDVLSIDQGYDEIPSFNDTVADYDETFFANNTLMLVYVEAGSGSFRYGVDSIYHADGNFCIHVKQTNHPEICTADMAGWFITVAVPDSMVQDCTEFDADLNNIEN